MSRVEHLGEGVTLYLGDCREIAATLPRPAAVISDPPYGIGGWSANASGGYMTKERAAEVRGWDRLPDREWLEALAALAPAVFWGGNYFDLPPCMALLIWDKEQPAGMHFAQAEVAWTNWKTGTVRLLRLPIKSAGTFGKKQHPTEKPLGVMEWCIQQARVPAGGLILDPYMGSGTTGVAAVRMGHAFTGIEIEPRYFETAVRRIAAELARPRLPLPEPVAKAVQGDMLDYSAAQHQPLFEVGS